MSNQIKHVFFDLDHTLWDFDKNSGLTFDKIFKLNQIDIKLNDFLKVYEPINLKFWKLYREEKVTKASLRYGRLKQAFDAVNINVEDDLINRLSEAYIEHLSSFNHLFEGAIEILDYLRNKYVLHIITNGFEEVQEKKMKGSGIRHYFETVTNSEMVGVKKPNPKVFNFALNIANAKATESIMIGDSLEADIEGAYHIGMDTIHFDYKDIHNAHNFKRITTLKAIENLL
ncbi:YjjG family noncanonical pyrimidine nucleotidase [Winogradskyella sp. PG-2]|uniref:YjjG family noncanonical pyrimidine nucleotidase n=1 Tax=Winogradskyella sp. PG-2 TaxID=754409 RepID=UPI00045883C7|nr:YjjG family noncanonical pyrimidine nucleotidase [Winogradskyella sp. PG-2]BAO74783.1 5'-nucleotidase YjjG [Winogradskyella sp. PG-2]